MKTLYSMSVASVVLYVFIVVGLFILSVFMIIYYFKMARHLEEIALSVKKSDDHLCVLENSLTESISRIEKSQSAQYERYFFDHCFMANLAPHDWQATGVSTDSHWEFRCSRCGQTLYVPKMLKENNKFAPAKKR